jgi:putative acetyltransferase
MRRNTAVRVRRYKGTDIPQIARLYYETVHRINARDYSESRLLAWAPRIYPNAYWRQHFIRCLVFVAVQDGEVAGFCELERTGHIDCFYVHHRWQGRGVGSSLMRRVEREARSRGIVRLFADVSITARPFFRKAGFQVVRRQKKIYRNRCFRQFSMEKHLRPGPREPARPPDA